MKNFFSKSLRGQLLGNVLDSGTNVSGPSQPSAEASESKPEVQVEPTRDQFDADDLVERLMGNEDLARRVASAFLNCMPQQLAALSEAINSFDAQATRLVAHSIKGAASNAGSEAVRNVASQLEEMAEAGAFASASKVLPELTATYESIKPMIERFCGSKS